MTLPPRHLALLGAVVALVHIGAFFLTTQLLATHGASMQAMIGKMDQVEYLQLADTMLGSHRFALSADAAPEIFRTPGYPAFVALTYLITGHWYWAPFAASGILLGLIAIVTALLAAALGLSRRASYAVGALIGISSGSFLLSMTATGSDVLYTLLYAGAALVAIRTQPGNLRSAIIIGIVLGLATLTRPIGILASLPLLFGAGIISRSGWRDYARATAVACAAWVLVLAPWYAHNDIVAGSPTLSTVSTFNITYYNIPMSEAFWHRASEHDARLAILHIIGTTTPDAMRGTAFLGTMERYNSSYLRSHPIDYGIFHLYRTIPFFFMSGFNVINAILSHEAPSLRSPLFPTEGENLTRHISAREWGAAAHSLGAYWFTTLERVSWLIAILAALASPLVAQGRTRRVLLLFAAIIIANIILVSPVTQARYRFPIEPFIWTAAVYTCMKLWDRYRPRA